MYKLKSKRVEELQNPIRIEAFCRGLFIELPSNKSVKKAVLKGVIKVNAKTVKTAYFLKIGDVVELWDLEESTPNPYKLEIKIIYEDDDLAVVFKPAGLVTSGNLFRTLENAIQGQLKPSIHNPLKWPRPVHRLDSLTSGLVIIAKSIPARIELGRMFEKKEISKLYCALLVGKYNGPSVIDFSIEGKKAISNIERLEIKESLNNGYISKVVLKPVTGRTHQLRIHTSKLGFPIVGDHEYGLKGRTLLHKGLFLCAVELNFRHPLTGAPIRAKVEVPKKFDALMEREYQRFLKYQKA
jgi:RluA family pseudouridine synthase